MIGVLICFALRRVGYCMSMGLVVHPYGGLQVRTNIDGRRILGNVCQQLACQTSCLRPDISVKLSFAFVSSELCLFFCPVLQFHSCTCGFFDRLGVPLVFPSDSCVLHGNGIRSGSWGSVQVGYRCLRLKRGFPSPPRGGLQTLGA